MPDRILDFSEEAAHLSVRLQNLVIRRGDKPEVTLPLADVGIVVISNPQVSLTQAVLSGLSGTGGCLIVCDDRRLPTGMLLPLVGNYVQSERIATQITAKVPLKKRLWQQVVRSKLCAQGRALQLETGGDCGLVAMAKRVRSGDPENVEAQAARRYWVAIFGDADFRRDREEAGMNAVLNYGYAVLRGIVARAVCAGGLHPSIGIHHHNRYNPFTLADDLMEPFRPVVDRAAVQVLRTCGPHAELDRVVKANMIDALNGRYVLNGERRSLFEITTRLASSLVGVFDSTRDKLELPDFREFFPDAAEGA